MKKTLGFLPLLVASWLVSACATSHPVVRAWEEAAPAAGCESPEEDSCVTLACEQGLCGFFRCEDVVVVEAPRSEVERVQFVRPGLPMGWPVEPGMAGVQGGQPRKAHES